MSCYFPGNFSSSPPFLPFFFYTESCARANANVARPAVPKYQNLGLESLNEHLHPTALHREIHSS